MNLSAKHLAMKLLNQTYNTKYKHKKPKQLNLTTTVTRNIQQGI